MKYIVSINGKNYEVEVEKGQATIVGTQQDVSVKPAQTAPSSPSPTSQSQASQPPAQAAPPAPQQQQQTVDGDPVKSPMPGTVLEIKVSQGATVKKGDVLFILEAMKMENDISAPKDGVVAQIAAQKGASVATGDILAVLQ